MSMQEEIEPKYDIYLCGPLSSLGRLEDNLAVFQDWAKKLRDAGYTVFSPPEGEDIGHTWQDYMRRDLQHLVLARSVALLPHWEQSDGAMMEYQLAEQLDIPTRPAADYLDSKFIASTLDLTPPSPSNPVPMEETILQEAERLVTRERGNAYGPPEQDFVRTASLWSGLFAAKLAKGETFKPRDVALAMICLKLSRATYGKKRDNAVDIAGYAACLHRVEHGVW